ncbi:MAG: hypothetical protein ACREF9_14815 [Opitutaceae bacterium]
MGNTLTRLAIARIQLERSIDLYVQGTTADLVCAVTLAAAAEEILGRLVKKGGAQSALEEAITRLCGMYEAAFREKSDPKVFVELRNKARNTFKHLSDGTDFSGDLEREASSMIRRAIENHRKLGCGFVDKYRAFQAEMVTRHQRRRGI